MVPISRGDEPEDGWGPSPTSTSCPTVANRENLARENINIYTMLMKPFYLRIYRCSTYTAGNKQKLQFLHFLKIIRAELRRTSQRTYKIFKSITQFSELQTSLWKLRWAEIRW
mgnify:CR=1 FL=1